MKVAIYKVSADQSKRKDRKIHKEMHLIINS